jgi:ribosomal protein S18 acetylase RimI-like enzyme
LAIVIREATERDYEALCTLIEEVDKMHRDALPRRFKASEGPARSRNYIVSAILTRDVGLFVAEIEGQPLGFVHVTVRDTPEIPILVPRRYAVVDNLAVKSTHRRRGVGRALMKKAEAWAKAQGATSIELTVYNFNEAGQDFYRELGYETLTHHMTKSLDAPELEGRDG